MWKCLGEITAVCSIQFPGTRLGCIILQWCWPSWRRYFSLHFVSFWSILYFRISLPLFFSIESLQISQKNLRSEYCVCWVANFIFRSFPLLGLWESVHCVLTVIQSLVCSLYVFSTSCIVICPLHCNRCQYANTSDQWPKNEDRGEYIRILDLQLHRSLVIASALDCG